MSGDALLNEKRCIGIGRLFGHRFRPRYSESKGVPQAGKVELTRGSAEDFQMMLESMRESTRTYHGDVCERCGLMVKWDTG